jgi:hypothetical protein
MMRLELGAGRLAALLGVFALAGPTATAPTSDAEEASLSFQ